MSKVQGFFPIIKSAFCQECKIKYVPEIPEEMFCEKCKSPLHIHVKVNSKDENVVRPIRVRDMLLQSSRYSRYNIIPHLFRGELRNILNVESYKNRSGKVAVAVEKYRSVECDPEDVFLEIHGGWYDNW